MGELDAAYKLKVQGANYTAFLISSPKIASFPLCKRY